MNQYCYDIKRIYTFYHEAQQILRGEMPVPRMAMLQPTFRCNHRCVYCLFGEMNEKYRYSMETKLLLRVIDEIADLGVKGLELCGGGEPLIHPGIAKAIRKAVDRGLKFAVLSNFSVGNRELLDLIARNASYVRASIDTFDEGIYHILHRPKGGQGLKEVLKNVERVITTKQRENSEMQVGAKILLTTLNYTNLTELTKRAIDMGFDSIQFKMARDTGLEVKSPQTVRNINAEINAIRRVFGEGGYIKVMGNAMEEGEIEKTGITKQCWLSPCHVAITPTGDVPLCCYYQEHFRNPLHIYGNIKEKPLKEIWYSERHWEAIRSTSVEECNRYDCKYHLYNEMMREALVQGKAQWEFI